MTRPAKLRVLLADDHTALLVGMRTLVESMPRATVVGEATNGSEAIEKYRTLRPDILVLDLRMPEVDGLQVVEKVLTFEANAKILVMTMYDGEHDVARALHSGAKGYILKSASREQIIAAITAVAQGERYVPERVALQLVAGASSPKLTPREREVLELLRVGMTNKDIAAALGVAPGTVKTHVQEVLEKLGATGRTEAVNLALARGLLR